MWRLLAYGAHHDGITGVESDQVYLDLLTGWRDAWELGRAARDNSLELLSGAISVSDADVVVWNPLTQRRTDIVTEHTFTRPGGGFHVIDLPGERFEAAAESNFQNDPLVLAVIDACGALAILLPADEALFSGHAASRFEARRSSGADVALPSEAVAAVEQRLEQA